MAGDSDLAQALWYVGPGRVEIREERLGALAGGHVRVRALYGAISRGTESLIAEGRVPVGEFQRMRYLRVLMSGAATALWNGFRPVNAA